MLIAGPNLTLDRLLRIDQLRPGEVLRFSDARIAPGGKGVNVARVARALGLPANLVALAPGRTGAAVVELLGREGLPVRAVPVGGEVRAASIVHERSGRVTVLNEPGPPIGGTDWEAFEAAVEEELAGHGWLVCIGSTPPGTPPHGYGRLVRLARARGVETVVDAAGSSLAAALAFSPDLVTPNLAEAEGVLRGDTQQPVADQGEGLHERALIAARALVDRGARGSVVTVGAGALVDRGSDRWWVAAPEVDERSPIGAGDSLVGGLAGSLERGAELHDALRIGVAAAAASVETELPGLVDPARVRSLVPKVDITPA
jgi:1-phosphofructokinase family hexose kinase